MAAKEQEVSSNLSTENKSKENDEARYLEIYGAKIKEIIAGETPHLDLYLWMNHLAYTENFSNETKRTVLHIAIKSLLAKKTKLLNETIFAGEIMGGLTLLDIAVIHGDLESTKFLLYLGAHDTTKTNPAKYQCFGNADLPEFRHIHRWDYKHPTAREQAQKREYQEVLDYLTSIDALLENIKNGNLEAVRKHLDSEPRIIGYKDANKHSLLHRALREQNIEIIVLLLSKMMDDFDPEEIGRCCKNPSNRRVDNEVLQKLFDAFIMLSDHLSKNETLDSTKIQAKILGMRETFHKVISYLENGADHLDYSIMFSLDHRYYLRFAELIASNDYDVDVHYRPRNWPQYAKDKSLLSLLIHNSTLKCLEKDEGVNLSFELGKMLSDSEEQNELNTETQEERQIRLKYSLKFAIEACNLVDAVSLYFEYVFPNMDISEVAQIRRRIDNMAIQHVAFPKEVFAFVMELARVSCEQVAKLTVKSEQLYDRKAQMNVDAMLKKNKEKHETEQWVVEKSSGGGGQIPNLATLAPPIVFSISSNNLGEKNLNDNKHSDNNKRTDHNTRLGL